MAAAWSRRRWELRDECDNSPVAFSHNNNSSSSNKLKTKPPADLETIGPHLLPARGVAEKPEATDDKWPAKLSCSARWQAH